ncbi:hypothetical protein [Streptomyces sp. NPDC048623]|uniref:hypothetical protein n=1 Tax=Streptomyces sp. NPDC048623 TaxID=3155761 RepID=UPI003434D0F6
MEAMLRHARCRDCHRFTLPGVWETPAAVVLLAATSFWITGLRRDAYDRARAASTVGW